MKKEKTIRTYQRRTKSGKVVTVKQHTAKYDAAEELRKALSKKKGAGDEFEGRKSRKAVQLEFDFNKKQDNEDTLGFTADDFKAWYHWDQDSDPKNKSALKVEKALKKQMGTKAYNKYFDEMSESYSARGHNKAFKGLGEKLSTGEKKSVISSKETKGDKSAKAKAQSYEVTVAQEDAKTQEKEAKTLDKKVDALEKKLRDLKYAHSGLKRNDPKKLKYAERIQKLQADLIATKKASAPKSEGTPTDKGKDSSVETSKTPKISLERHLNTSNAWAVKDEGGGNLQVKDDKGRISAVTIQKMGGRYYIYPNGSVHKMDWSAKEGYATSSSVKKALMDRLKSTEGNKESSTKTPTNKGEETHKKNAVTEERKKERKKSSEPRAWKITYNERTPMGLSGSADRTVVVYAKTKRGAMGEYKRNYHRGPDSAYATTLYRIEPHEE